MEKSHAKDSSIFKPYMKEELFNLCHASACNVIKHIFGILKQKFQILHLGPEYSLDIQACIPAALAAFACHHEHGKEDGDEGGDGDELIGGRVENNNNDTEWADVGVNVLE